MDKLIMLMMITVMTAMTTKLIIEHKRRQK
jgi:hypothetical protein